ncbi:hypothetical protein VTN96DRAFT_5106 [Rasamsonia emersonii]
MAAKTSRPSTTSLLPPPFISSFSSSPSPSSFVHPPSFPPSSRLTYLSSNQRCLRNLVSIALSFFCESIFLHFYALKRTEPSCLQRGRGSCPIWNLSSQSSGALYLSRFYFSHSHKPDSSLKKENSRPLTQTGRLFLQPSTRHLLTSRLFLHSS